MTLRLPVEHEIWEILEFLLDLERGEPSSPPEWEAWERVFSYVAMQKGAPSRKFYSNFKKFPHDPIALSKTYILLQEITAAKKLALDRSSSVQLSNALFSLLSVTHPHAPS